MAASMSMCCTLKVLARHSSDDRRISSSSAESAVSSLASAKPPITTESKKKSIDMVRARWATVAAAAAATVSVLTAAPQVLAGEMEVFNGMITHSVPGDLSLNIAIPIPDPDTWTYSTYGFLAPPPGVGVAVVSNYQGGCPAWQPSQFEMIVPDGVHPKHYPRHGSQWPALYMLEEATVEYPAIDSKDPGVKYASLIDALLRMSDSGLTCFSL